MKNVGPEIRPEDRKRLEEFENAREELQAHSLAKQQLLAQLNENEAVMKELDLLEENATLFKTVGIILVKQSRQDARQIVRKRLDFIKDEIRKADQLTESLSSKLEKQAQEFRGAYLKHMGSPAQPKLPAYTNNHS